VHSLGEGDAAFRALGDRVRELRARRGMTRKILAKDSGVSERYLAQLETGQGNASLAILRRIARALDVPLEALVADAPEAPADLAQAVALLRRLGPEQLGEARALLVRTFGEADAAGRAGRIALIGLRGAGKTTLGAALAERLGVPFVELDREVERAGGVPLATIFDFYGQPGFRRLERRCLDRVIEEHPRFVLATGGSIVSEPSTFERLLAACFTVWLKAAPAEHMARVVAQGDMRPMAGNREAMADLQRILAGREPLYRRADAEVDTTAKEAGQSIDALLHAIPGPSGRPSAGRIRYSDSLAPPKAER
jgi:XRE family aerobic/anaerobic benzoate catabolism transcriptional regulator